MGKGFIITVMFAAGWFLAVTGYFAYFESWRVYNQYGQGLWGITCSMVAMIVGIPLVVSAIGIFVLSMRDYIRNRH